MELPLLRVLFATDWLFSRCLYCQVSGKMCDFVVGKYQVPTNETVALVNRAELVARIKESADRTAAFSNQSVIDCCHRRAMDEVAMHLKWVAQVSVSCVGGVKRRSKRVSCLKYLVAVGLSWSD